MILMQVVNVPDSWRGSDKALYWLAFRKEYFVNACMRAFREVENKLSQVAEMEYEVEKSQRDALESGLVPSRSKRRKLNEDEPDLYVGPENDGNENEEEYEDDEDDIELRVEDLLFQECFDDWVVFIVAQSVT